MKISDIPWYDRPGARLRKYGAGVLTDAELFSESSLRSQKIWIK